MAEVRGRKCDRPECNVLVTDAGPNVPKGWIVVRPITERNDDPSFEFCSNYCAAYVLVDRYEAETGKRLVRQPKRKDG